jgi:hypothetical protein
VHRFVPQPPASAPLGYQRGLGGASGPEPVRVSDHLAHSNILSKDVVMHQQRYLRPTLSVVKDGVFEADNR